MKRTLNTIVVFILFYTLSNAQTEFDASKILQSNINGTARYMGMAGAMGAVGGDATAIKDNPAGIGLYKQSELSATGNLQLQKSNATWYSGKGFYSLMNIGPNSFSFVLVPESDKKSQPKDKKDKKKKRQAGMFSNNYAFSYNKLKNFYRTSYLSSNANATTTSIIDYIAFHTPKIVTAANLKTNAFTTENIPWISGLTYNNLDSLIIKNKDDSQSPWLSALGNSELITPSYYISEKGSIDEYSFGWAGSYNNLIHLGATANLQTVNYSSLGEYTETQQLGRTLKVKDSISTKGFGINFKVGAIICPNEFLRFGISVQTPTIYSLKDNFNGQLTYNKGTLNIANKTPIGSAEYKLQNLTQFIVSAAYIYGEKGIFSAEFDYSRNSRATFEDKNGSPLNYIKENQAIKKNLKNIGRLKIGGEYNINENITVRAGYAFTSSSTDENANETLRENTKRIDTQYLLGSKNSYESVGVGYHKDKWSVDLAFTNQIVNETFQPYNYDGLALNTLDPLKTLSPGKIKTSLNNIVVSFGYKL